MQKLFEPFVELLALVVVEALVHLLIVFLEDLVKPCPQAHLGLRARSEVYADAQLLQILLVI